MALLNILEYPDPRLYKIAAPVPAVTPEIKQLVRDLAKTMYAAPGVGLAATQVNVHKRVIVIDVSEAKNELLTLINPEIITAEGEADSEALVAEGCDYPQTQFWFHGAAVALAGDYMHFGYFFVWILERRE